MPQVFSARMNVIARVSIVGTLGLLASALWVGLTYTRSSYGTGMGVSVVQSVPFSHQHHVGILGIDCRYCHTSVEHSSFAGMPPTKTCMNCHSQIWVGSQCWNRSARATVRISRFTGTGSIICPASSISTTAFTCKKALVAHRVTAGSTRCRSPIKCRRS